MDDDEIQQFCLRWHNHQCSVVGALGRMLGSGLLADVTLSAGGGCVRAHRLVLASCSQYFAQLFKDVECESNALVVVLECELVELRLLLTFMYTGEVTASKRVLPKLLRLAHTLQVSGLAGADTNSTLRQTEPDGREESVSPINLEMNPTTAPLGTDSLPPPAATAPWLERHDADLELDSPSTEEKDHYGVDFLGRNDKERLSKLDQIVQNLYTSHKIGHPTIASALTPTTPPVALPTPDGNVFETRTYRGAGAVAGGGSSVCSVCNKRLSNQYNLRVHMETHAGRRHACRACTHVSRSRDALRKHVAYRHARATTHLDKHI